MRRASLLPIVPLLLAAGFAAAQGEPEEPALPLANATLVDDIAAALSAAEVDGLAGAVADAGEPIEPTLADAAALDPSVAGLPELPVGVPLVPLALPLALPIGVQLLDAPAPPSPSPAAGGSGEPVDAAASDEDALPLAKAKSWAPFASLVPSPFASPTGGDADRADDTVQLLRTSAEATVGGAGARGGVEAPPPEPDPASTSPLAVSSTLATVAIAVTFAIGVASSLYSRFHEHDLLRSKARAGIHAFVHESPGATLAELARATGMGRGALVHHCQMLEKHGLLASRHDGLNRRFFPPGPVAAPVARPPTQAEARLLGVIAQQGPLTQREIASLLDVSPQAVHEQVRRLAQHGRIAEDDDRRWHIPG